MDSSASTIASHTTTADNTPPMATSPQPTAASYGPQQIHDHSSKTSSSTATTSAASLEVSPGQVVNLLVDPFPAGTTPFNAPLPTTSIPAANRQPSQPTDPMRRVFPKPDGDINVAEALARKPLPWTLGHWRKNFKEIVPRAETEEIKRQKFEDAKAKLLLDQEKLNQGQTRKGACCEGRSRRGGNVL